jgi:hypothetical protein
MHFAASIRVPTTGRGAELKGHGFSRAEQPPTLTDAAIRRDYS